MLDCRDGFVTLSVSGKKSYSVFQNEGGGHRWQRVPPNEKRNRVHTSTITVAVLPVENSKEIHVSDRDIEMKTCRGSGPGGQHRNKVNTAVQLRYLPTNLIVRCETYKSQFQNREVAMEILRAKLAAGLKKKEENKINDLRDSQVGSGKRGDKRRTIRVQHGIVEDHITGQTWRFQDYENGKW